MAVRRPDLQRFRAWARERGPCHATPVGTKRINSRRAVVGLVVAFAGMPVVLAQMQRGPVQIVQQAERPFEDAGTPDTVLIEPSSPILNLFSRADEGILRRDWKFAIDSLQRIIDDPDGSLIAALEKPELGITVYESTRRRAVKQLAELPPEALTAYRLLYDGRAKGLYERAAATLDESLLRQVVERFVLTRYGDDASDLLASWLLDGGRYGEAIDVLTECIELVPDRDVPESLMVGKLAAAYLASGRKAEAVALLELHRRKADAGEAEKELPDWLAGLPEKVDGRDGAPAEGGAVITMTPDSRLPMPAVEPTLIDPAPWRYELPGEVVYLWQRAQVSELDEPVLLPAAHAATDGERVYVRRPSGCAALDAEDLSVIWEAVAPDTAATARSRRVSGQAATIPWTASTVYEDYQAGALSVAHGLVFTLEREGMGALREGDEVRNAPQVPGVVGFTVARTPTATRLLAWDSRTGEQVWERGRTFDAADPLGDAEFRATPIAVGDELWVAYTQQGDLYVATLRPEDGQLMRRTLLCSLRQAPTPVVPKLPISYANGTVFVPSARGALFAVDANTHSLRWAVQYPQPEGPTQEPVARRVPRALGGVPPLVPDSPVHVMSERAEWLPTPPVVSGGLVMILSRQNGRLFAFSADRGELRWSALADGCAHVLAADHQYVWLGGRTVRCFSLNDGSSVWSFTLSDPPTGWGVLAGERLLFPTVAGLTELDAATGKELRSEEISEAQGPLGNLLVAGNSVYSVDPSSVRKFPDVARTYAKAKERLFEEPSDYVAGLRLAWMQLLKDEPDRAYETLASISPDVLVNDPRREAAVTHVRVSALLAMAANARTGPSRALDLLREAVNRSASAGDRVRSALAMAEQFARMDRPLEAYETLWSLSRTPDAELLVPVAEQVEAASRVDIARRMRGLESRLTTEQLKRINEQGLEVVNGAMRVLRDRTVSGSERILATRMLEAVADMETPRAVAAAAMLELAAVETDRQRYERVETLLHSCLRLNAGDETTLTALLRLCAMYEAQGEGARDFLKDGLADLNEKYGDFEVPAGALPCGDGEREAVSSTMTVREWTATMSNRLGLEGDAGIDKTEETSTPIVESEANSRWVTAWTLTPRNYQDNQAVAPFALTGELQQALDGLPGTEPPRLVHLRGRGWDRLSPHVLFHSMGDIVYCQKPTDGKLLWQTTLRMPEQFAEGLDMSRGRATEGVRQAVADGQIAVINGNTGLFALGLLSGRQLWIRAHEPPLRTGQEYVYDRRMAARDGLLAAMTRPGRLTLMRMRDGSTIWERDLRGEPIGLIELTDSRVITGDPYMQRIHLFDRADGRLIGRMLLRQPEPEVRTVSLVETGGIICGPDADASGDMVTAVRMEDGTLAWRIHLEKPIAQIFEPGDGYVGVGMLGGDIKLIDATTGEVAFERHLTGVHGVTDAILLKKNLLIRGITMQATEQRIALMAIDLSRPEEIWRREDLATPAWASVPFGVIDGAVPAVIEYGQPSIPNEARVRFGFAMIDVETGATRSTIPDIVPPRSRSRINGDVAVWPDAVVLGTGTGIQAYVTIDSKLETRQETKQEIEHPDPRVR